MRLAVKEQGSVQTKLDSEVKESTWDKHPNNYVKQMLDDLHGSPSEAQ
jgi:hypothetical protein